MSESGTDEPSHATRSAWQFKDRHYSVVQPIRYGRDSLVRKPKAWLGAGLTKAAVTHKLSSGAEAEIVALLRSGSARVLRDGRATPHLMAIVPPWDQRLAHTLMRRLCATPITPNQITVLSLAIGWLAAWLYAAGGAAVHLGGLCFMLSFWLDHADGELARMTGRTSIFGHYFDLAAGGAVLVAVFIGIGIGASAGALGAWSIGLGLGAALATAAIFVLRMELERRAGKAAVRQPNLLGFEIEDMMYLLGPITWLGLLQPFLVLAGIGAPGFALVVLWQRRRLLAGRGA